MEIHKTKEEIQALIDRLYKDKEIGFTLGEAALLTNLLTFVSSDFKRERESLTKDIIGSQVTARIMLPNKIYLAFFCKESNCPIVVEYENENLIRKLAEYYSLNKVIRKKGND